MIEASWHHEMLLAALLQDAPIDAGSFQSNEPAAVVNSEIITHHYRIRQKKMMEATVNNGSAENKARNPVKFSNIARMLGFYYFGHYAPLAEARVL